MKKYIILSLALWAIFSPKVFAVPGITDKVPGATLIVPFFEVGIDSSVHSNDTLLVVTNLGSANQMVHYEVWDIDGNPTGINGNFSLNSKQSQSFSLRLLTNSATEAQKAQLTAGEFYHGFMTFDAVTAAPKNPPNAGCYPFSSNNWLKGYIYYVRLLEGSSNGIDMISIESVDDSVHPYLQDFYQGDQREEIDAYARGCANALATGGNGCEPVVTVGEIVSRVFQDPNVNGRSRIILFMWDPEYNYGLSVLCQNTNYCPASYPLEYYSESGALVQRSSVRLDHVVNIIDVSGSESGWVSIKDIPGSVGAFQMFAFSFNSANPPASAGFAASWDAIFESFIKLK